MRAAIPPGRAKARTCRLRLIQSRANENLDRRRNPTRPYPLAPNLWKTKTSLHRTVNRLIIDSLGEIALPVFQPLPHRNETPSQSRRIHTK